MADEPTNQQPGNLETQELLDLAAPERIVPMRLSVRTPRRAEVSPDDRMVEHRFAHVFSPFTLRDWLDYLRELRPGLQQEGEEIEPQEEETRAAATLWERKVVRIEGYRSVRPDDWKRKVPILHKVQAIRALRDVGAAEGGEPDPFDLSGDTKTVVLEAGWNEHFYTRLEHVFAEPTVEQGVEYDRTKMRWVRVGGARKTNTLVYLTPRLGQLSHLYDQLIRLVRGYSVNGRKLEDLEEIVRVMDPWHKQAAVSLLFGDRPEAGSTSLKADG